MRPRIRAEQDSSFVATVGITSLDLKSGPEPINWFFIMHNSSDYKRTSLYFCVTMSSLVTQSGTGHVQYPAGGRLIGHWSHLLSRWWHAWHLFVNVCSNFPSDALICRKTVDSSLQYVWEQVKIRFSCLYRVKHHRSESRTPCDPYVLPHNMTLWQTLLLNFTTPSPLIVHDIYCTCCCCR